MKKAIASAGMVAVGAAGLHGANAPGLSRMETSKPWSIAASIRGFYDDNYTQRSSSSGEDRDSFGFEFAPSASFHIPKDQTYFGGTYEYSLKYFEDRESDEFDQTHRVRLNLDHRFSERHRMRAREEFIYSDEPELVDQSNLIRQDASGMRNIARLELFSVLTERFGLSGGYQNNWWNYDDKNSDYDDGTISRSALLDRIEHLINIDARYQATELIIALVGYQFALNDYDGDEPISNAALNPPTSDDRDNIAHYVYAGAEGSLSDKTTVSAKVGAQYTDYTEVDDNEVSPYVELAATHTYAPGSSLQGGVRHFRTATDVSGGTTDGRVTIDQEVTAVFASLNHRITGRLTGTAYAHYQNGEFNGGTADGESDNYFYASAGLDYEITKNLYAEAKYSFDRLDSDRQGRSFTRNRVSLGLRAKY